MLRFFAAFCGVTACLALTSAAPAQSAERPNSAKAARKFYASLAKAVKDGQTEESPMAGTGDHPFTSVYKHGGYLIGVDISYGAFAGSKLIIRSVRPIYQTIDGRKYGTQWGIPSSVKKRILAKPGYAVAALNVNGGLNVDGLQVVFMKRTGTTLDPDTSYKTPWYGSKGLREPKALGGDGRLVLGLFGRTSGLKVASRQLRGVGLVLLKEK